MSMNGPHDNSVRMWTQYFTAGRGGRLSDAVVHRARARYHGRLFARRVIDLGGPASSYLEVGVGTGETLKWLWEATEARCVGVDKTPRSCSLARANTPSCGIVSADGLRLPFADESFDVVYSLGLLEHFEPAEQVLLLREHARVARRAVLLHLPAATPHLRLILWFNRVVCGRSGVWADEELFTPTLFRRRFPGLPFRSLFDWTAGAMTYWFSMAATEVRNYVDIYG